MLTDQQRDRLSLDRIDADAEGHGTKPCIEMWIEDGQLEMGRVGHRPDVVADVDLAIQRLLVGERVYVQQYGPTVTRVQRTLAMVLRRAGAYAAAA